MVGGASDEDDDGGMLEVLCCAVGEEEVVGAGGGAWMEMECTMGGGARELVGNREWVLCLRFSSGGKRGCKYIR